MDVESLGKGENGELVLRLESVPSKSHCNLKHGVPEDGSFREVFLCLGLCPH